jgi:hypothetical protein
MESWFSSLGLFHKLCGKQTDAMKTLHQNRNGVPPEIKSTKLKTGEYVSVYKDISGEVKWKNEKDNYLIGTTHDDMEKPEVVTDYNLEMGGIDLSDIYLTSYRNTRKSLKKYYQNHFFHLIDICHLNSYLLYKKKCGSISRMECRVELTESLISKYRVTEQSKTCVNTMLCATKRVNFVKQGTTAKTVGWPCVLHPISNITTI